MDRAVEGSTSVGTRVVSELRRQTVWGLVTGSTFHGRDLSD